MAILDTEHLERNQRFALFKNLRRSERLKKQKR